MFDKFKEAGTQLGTKATETLESATVTVKEQADKITTATGEAATAVSDQVIRNAVNRLRRVVRIATEELEKDLPKRPATLTASFQIGMVTLELDVELRSADSAAPAQEPPAPDPAGDAPASNTD